MKKGQNSNRPGKGSSIKVEPIRELKDIKSIKKLLADNPRDLCLFVLGINTNLRASDLCRITVGDVRDLKVGDDFAIKEKKTGKTKRVTANKAVVEAIQAMLSVGQYNDDDSLPLFCSQRGNQALTVPSVHRLVKLWCKQINLKGNFGSHTLRKTFGYQHRMAGTSIPELMTIFNHSTQKQTLDYLCVQPEEIKSAYLRLNL